MKLSDHTARRMYGLHMANAADFRGMDKRYSCRACIILGGLICSALWLALIYFALAMAQ